MELASAKYAQCRLNAESKYSKTLDAAKRTAALTKCSTNLGSAFTKATDKYGAACAATETSSAFDDYLKQCLDDATAAAAGAALPDYVGELASCNADLATCNGDLATCEGDLAASEALPPARLLKTGQTTAYGAGSDGDLQKGIAQGYVDNGDGTITDTSTGLMWEKKSDDGTIHDKDNAYTWSGASYGSTNVLDGTAATTFLAALNAGGGFAGHTDWRLPNQTELYSLINLQNLLPAVSAAFNTGCAESCTVLTCSCTVNSFYWSSSTYATNPPVAWMVAFNDGIMFPAEKFADLYVRAVRGGS
jgi:hypothetical protein